MLALADGSLKSAVISNVPASAVGVGCQSARLTVPSKSGADTARSFQVYHLFGYTTETSCESSSHPSSARSIVRHSSKRSDPFSKVRRINDTSVSLSADAEKPTEDLDRVRRAGT